MTDDRIGVLVDLVLARLRVRSKAEAEGGTVVEEVDDRELAAVESELLTYEKSTLEKELAARVKAEAAAVRRREVLAALRERGRQALEARGAEEDAG